MDMNRDYFTGVSFLIGCALIASAIVHHAGTGRYSLLQGATPLYGFDYYKFDTQDGQVYWCSSKSYCINVSTKEALDKSPSPKDDKK